jgi:transcriptional regulator with PAS, ATPase and Fis domain
MDEKLLFHYISSCVESFYNFIIVDTEGKIVYVNQQYSKVLGLPLEKIMGQDVQKLIPNTRMLDILKTQKEDIGSIMTLYDHNLEREVTVVCNRRPLWYQGKLIGAMAETTNRNLNEVKHLYNKINKIQAENHQYRAQIEVLTTKKGPLDAIVGQSPALMIVKKAVLDYAWSDLPILFTGPTGTGKELFSNATQQLSQRSQNSFVKVNCSAIPKDLMESEFFGYEEGAFTGAKKGGKPGKIELANGGTLLLDEVGELPLQLQAKLLRVLQEYEVERVGGTKSTAVNFRLLCSTNRDLMQMVCEGTFRSDLYYRINTVELNIPPLKLRIDDLPLLCASFIQKINQSYGFQIKGISQKSLSLLATHSWPGNVRELEHVIERAAVLCKEELLTIEYFAFFKPTNEPADDNYAILDTSHESKRFLYVEERAETLNEKRANSEMEAILEALRKTGGNKAKAARILNIDRSNLYAKIKKYKIRFEME